MSTLTNIRRRTTGAVLGLCLAIVISGPVLAGEPEVTDAPNGAVAVGVHQGASLKVSGVASTDDRSVSRLGVEWTFN